MATDMYIGAPSHLMIHVQSLVKRLDGRFIGYRWQYNKKVQYFSLWFDTVHLSNRFGVMMEIIKQPYF